MDSKHDRTHYFSPWMLRILCAGVWPFRRIDWERLHPGEGGRVFLWSVSASLMLAIAVVTGKNFLYGAISLVFGGPIAFIMSILFTIADAVILISLLVVLATTWVGLFYAIAPRRTSDSPAGAVGKCAAAGAGSIPWIVLPVVGAFFSIVVFSILTTRAAIAYGLISRKTPQGLAATVGLPIVLLGLAFYVTTSLNRPFSRPSMDLLGLALPGKEYYSTRALHNGMLQYTITSRGELPMHAIELAKPEWKFPILVFSENVDGMRPRDILLVTSSFADFIEASAERQREMIAEVLASRDWEAVNHYRFGAYIFLCPGFRVPSGAKELWIIIRYPSHQDNYIIVGTWRHGVIQFPVAEWRDRIVLQNVLRESIGLSPLPTGLGQMNQ